MTTSKSIINEKLINNQIDYLSYQGSAIVTFPWLNIIDKYYIRLVTLLGIKPDLLSRTRKNVIEKN